MPGPCRSEHKTRMSEKRGSGHVPRGPGAQGRGVSGTGAGGLPLTRAPGVFGASLPAAALSSVSLLSPPQPIRPAPLPPSPSPSNPAFPSISCPCPGSGGQSGALPAGGRGDDSQSLSHLALMTRVKQPAMSIPGASWRGADWELGPLLRPRQRA